MAHATIFDWDDTLFPTSWWLDRANGIPEAVGVSELSLILRALEILVCNLIVKAKSRGPVAIITNSKAQWVLESAQLLYPKSVQCFEGINIISARDRYEETTADSSSWKTLAFADYMANISSQENHGKLSAILSVGDSLSERDALIDCGQLFEGLVMKSLKFVECPKIDDVLHQLAGLIGVLDDVYDISLNQDLAFSRDCQKISSYQPPAEQPKDHPAH